MTIKCKIHDLEFTITCNSIKSVMEIADIIDSGSFSHQPVFELNDKKMNIVQLQDLIESMAKE